MTALRLHQQGDHPPKRLTPMQEAHEQVKGVYDDLAREPEDFLRWPWADLDAMTGGLADGTVWFVCAFSGAGKTTFVTSAVNAWLDQGRRVYVLPLETQPKDFRLTLACQRIGLHPGDVTSGALARRLKSADPAERLAAESAREEIAEVVADMASGTIGPRLRIPKGVDFIDTRKLEWAVVEAAGMGADVLIADHIDHIGDGGTGGSLYEESVRVNKKALALAQKHNVALLLTSQCNNEIAGGHDRLARYQPPRETHVLMGGHKRQVATGMIGLFRRIRPRASHETEEDYKALLERVRKGQAQAVEVLDPTVMGVVQMKDRNYGRDGRWCFLSYEHGRVGDLTPEQRRELDAATHGIRTNRGL